MESSDDSFVWTDASNANTDSDYSSTEDTMKEKHYESECEKNYKKKLHKKLFKTELEIKHELLNGDRVKHEAESDAPAPPSPAASPRKCKRKRERSPSAGAEDDAADTKPADVYLDTRVKQEQQARASDSCDEPPKKKKAKKKKERKESSEMIIEDKFTAEETIVETRPDRNISTSIDIDCYNKESAENLSKKEKKKKKKIRQDSSKLDSENNSSLMEVTNNDNDVSEILTLETYDSNSLENVNDKREVFNSKRNKKLNTSTNKSTKISDLIQFEDGEDVIAACNEGIENTVSTKSSKLRRFLKANPHLHSLTSTSNSGDSLISQDDDIWLFNCPQEMNISSLKDTSLALDNKCKIKIENQTFIGNVESEVNRAAILTFEHNRPVIKSLVINGIVNFHKRIPKAHYLDDNIVANNQTDFICLPDTKCRHPLFGPDYKKAIKIPAAVKSRLENPPLEYSLVPKESKKRKKRKHDKIDISEDVVDDSEAVAGEDKRRRERKRRRSERDPDQPVKKKAKRIKQELESAETWDSEKAIEENLFNF